MALQVSSDAQLVFFSTVFGPTSPTTFRVKGLLAAGVTFEVSLYSVRAFKGGKSLNAVQLSYGTTALMKGKADAVVLAQNQHVINEWVSKLYQDYGHVTDSTVYLSGASEGGHVLLLIKAVKTLTGSTLLEAKETVDKALAGELVALGTFSTAEAAQTAAEGIKAAKGLTVVAPAGVKPVIKSVLKVPAVTVEKPVDAVIDLKSAKALGQKVHGTSAGSVYHTIALTEHVKVAARIIPGGSISIRTEWTDTPTADLKKLADSGVQMKATYGSIHFDPQEVPVQRVIGAFLVGTGINWKAMVTNGTALVVGGQ